MDIDESWSSRSTALSSSIRSDSSYGQDTDTPLDEQHRKPFNYSNSYGLTDKTPLLFSGTKDDRFTVLQSWRAVITMMRGPQRLWSTTIATIVAALCTLLAGYTLGYPSTALQQLNDLSGEFAIHNDSVLQDLFGALAPVGALFGGANAGWAVDLLGRRNALMMVALPNLIGWLMISLANNCASPAGFKSLLLIGRFITGFAMGWSLLSSPVYIAEVSPATLRGLFSTLTQLALAFGILLVYSIGSIPDFHYTYIALVAVGITAIFTLLMAFLPETPRFLLSKNKQQEATEVLQWLRGPRVSTNEERLQMQTVIWQERRMSCGDLHRELSKRSAYIPLILMIFIMMFQQLCGINVLVFYGVEVFTSADLGSGSSSFITLVAIGLTELVFTAVTLFTVDLVGRKVLLIVSGSIMTVSSFILGTTFYLAHAYPRDHLQPLAVACVLLFVMGFALGWGAVPWTLVSEIFPLQVHGLLGGVVSAVNWACAAIVAGFYFKYSLVVGLCGVWWTFGAISLFGVVFVSVFLPETRGKQLEIIEHLMQNRYSLCSWN